MSKPELPEIDHFALAKAFLEHYQMCKPYGMKYEFLEWFFRNLNVTVDQIHGAGINARHEWDLG